MPAGSGDNVTVPVTEPAQEQPADTAASGQKEAVENSSLPEKPEHSAEEIRQEVIKVLKTCYDPEIPVDVYELGLIYDIKAATNGDVLIVMTLTSPACPVAGSLPLEIEQKVKEHPMVNDCKVEITFDPPWNQRMMSEVAMLELGFL
ncbi:MAG: iron-sulfur cluster assembly protein [Ignavibacteria bacterium]|nr:iron-sulfur cluster assembly protein [Ignavibacteria bacterium]